ncbi:MAG: transketolase C-terminal domain-containing protein, partial [Pseudothermotoga sp.]
RQIEAKEIRYEEYRTEDADVLIVAHGTVGRIAKSVVKMAREEGIKAGLFRPITLYPFAYEALSNYGEKTKLVLTVEMSSGQMLEDVKLSLCNKTRIEFYGRMAGVVPTPEEVFAHLKSLIGRQ